MMQAAAPPAPVTMTRQQADAFFSQYPVLEQGGRRYRLLGLNLTGSRDVTDAAKVKLAAEGWSADYMRGRNGEEVLSINTQGKTPEQAMKLAARLQANEFGSVAMQTFAVPDPSAAK